MSRALRLDHAAALLALVTLAACSSSTDTGSAASPTEPVATGSPDAGSAPPVDEAGATATKVALWLSGDFDSSAQAARDPSYRSISLSACPVNATELGAHALYIEQAVVGSPAPYRQRVYIVEPVDATTARSLVFELANPEAAVGLCKRPKATFAKADVIARVGCSVEMHWTSDHFVGHTPNARWNGSSFEPDAAGAKCPSTLEGASYAQSKVELRDGKLTSWDQGFDEKNKQVWGAVKGPYQFVRKSLPLTTP